jgi:hypothetical protein
VAVDFLSSLVAAWAADAGLAAAGIPTLHLSTHTGPEHRYAVIGHLGGRVTHRNYGRGQVHESHYRVNLFADDADAATALAVAARTFLESLAAAPPAFDDGRLTDSYQSGDALALTMPRRPGRDGSPFTFLSSLTWTFRISRDRA